MGGFLVQDYSISCASNLYSTMQIFALVMVFIYPIGIPLMYFSLLQANKGLLYFGDEATAEQLAARPKALKFLYDPVCAHVFAYCKPDLTHLLTHLLDSV